MNDADIEHFLAQPENELLDFKETSYELSTSAGRKLLH